MSKKNHNPGPVPPGNKPQAGPGFGPGTDNEPDPSQAPGADQNTGAEFQDQDPKRRLGNFEGAGEHSRQQPGRANDGDVHSK